LSKKTTSDTTISRLALEVGGCRKKKSSRCGFLFELQKRTFLRGDGRVHIKNHKPYLYVCFLGKIIAIDPNNQSRLARIVPRSRGDDGCDISCPVAQDSSGCLQVDHDTALGRGRPKVDRLELVCLGGVCRNVKRDASMIRLGEKAPLRRVMFSVVTIQKSFGVEV